MALGNGYLARKMKERFQARWEAATQGAASAPISELRRDSSTARRLRRTLDGFLNAVQPRLLATHAEPVVINPPLGAEAIWRPELWRAPVTPGGVVATENATALGGDVSLYHDCPLRELILRQVPVLNGDAHAPYAVRVEVMGFEGSFLSLAVQLPPMLIQGLRRDHVVRVSVGLQTERPIQLYARLNVRHGPNVEQLLRALPRVDPGREGETLAEFDLHDSEINEKRIESGWLDLIFERPQMNAVTLNDIVVLRYPRADL